MRGLGWEYLIKLILWILDFSVIYITYLNIIKIIVSEYSLQKNACSSNEIHFLMIKWLNEWMNGKECYFQVMMKVISEKKNK